MAIEGDGRVYTLEEGLAALGFGKYQWLVLAYSGLGYMADAMEVMILSFIGPAVKTRWGLSSAQESLLSSVVFAGMLIGAYSWGLISDRYGRRKGLLSIAVVTSASALLSAFSFNYGSLLILRCLVGFGLGGGPVYSSWFLEFIPTQNRGTWMVIFSTLWTFGSILEASLAWIIMPRLGWRWLLGVSSAPTIMALLFYGFAPESPRHLCAKGRLNEAYDILKKIAAVNHRELPFGRLVMDQLINLDEEDTSLEDSHFLSLRRNKPKISETVLSSTMVLFSSELLKTTLLILMVYFGNAFLYYGIVLLTSKLSSQQRECPSFAIHSENSSDAALYRDTFITSFAEIPGLILSAFSVDRIGRKASMVYLYLLGFIFVLPLVLHLNEILTTALLFGARMCFIGTFTVLVVYVTEIYPTSTRATGVGFSNAVGRIGGLVCPIVAVGLVDGCHQTTGIILMEIIAVISGVCVQLFPVETKGRKLVDNVEVPNSAQGILG